MAVVLIRTYHRRPMGLPEQIVVAPIARFSLYEAAANELGKRMRAIEGGPKGQEEMDEVLKWYRSTSRKWQRWDG